MAHGQYLYLMGACVLVTLPLELVLGARVYRSPRRLTAALLPALILFIAWDVVAISRNHWWFNPAYVTGIRIGTVPLEELVFFVVIPICGLLTYEAVGKVWSLARSSGKLRFRWPDGLVRVPETREHKAGAHRA